MHKDSTPKIFLVATLLCLICSTLVSTTAVLLKAQQKQNIEVDKKRNIMATAGLIQEKDKISAQKIEEMFSHIKAVAIDLKTGQEEKSVDPKTYDYKKAAKDGFEIPEKEDIAQIKRRPNVVVVYYIYKKKKLDQIILPIHGKGLWSSIYGFLSIDRDTKTVRGLNFYEQAETPGLGGEIANPRWKEKWNGKVVYDGKFQVILKASKIKVSPEKAKHTFDALSGATITTRGIENMLHYWLGKNGYGPFLSEIRKRKE